MNTTFTFNGGQSEILAFNALLSLLGRRSRQSIYDLMRRDPSFPKDFSTSRQRKETSVASFVYVDSPRKP
jgi:predicted DNA-binding transcriptional regulator AlpA